MSAYIDGNGYIRPIYICKCGGEQVHVPVPFPNMRARACKKCKEVQIENVEMAEMIMKQMVQMCGEPPHIIAFDRGIQGAIGVKE